MTQAISNLIDLYFSQKTAASRDESISYLHAHETIGRLSRFYEALRNAVDLKEEHLLRRNAIERILKRLVILENRSGANIGRELLLELIRAGYLSNDTLPENRVFKFEKIINKYIKIITGIGEPLALKQKLENWILSIASVEIEEELNPQQIIQEKIIAKICFNEFLSIIKTTGATETEFKTQTYIAIFKTILKADEAILRLRLLNAHAEGIDAEDQESLNYITKNIGALYATIENEIKSKLNIKISCAIKNFAPIFWILSDVIKETSALYESKEEIFQKIDDEEYRGKIIKRICDRRYFEAKMKLARATKKSIIFLLLTKTILALILELPYGFYILKKVNRLSLGINIIFHPILLGVIAAAIKRPTEENTQKIARGIKELIGSAPKKEIFVQQKIIASRSPILNIALNIIYTIISILIFILVIMGLVKLGFNILSVILFCFFLSLVSFLGWKSRKAVGEMFVTDKKENIFSLLLDFFALPVISIGQWLVKRLPKFNMFTIIMDFLIEAPFQVIIGGLESWARFAKEKREEIEI